MRVFQQESLRIIMKDVHQGTYWMPKQKHCLVRAAQESQSKLYMFPLLAPASEGQTNAVLQKHNPVPSLRIGTQSAYKQERHTEISALAGIQVKVKEAGQIFPGVPSAIVIVCGYA